MLASEILNASTEVFDHGQIMNISNESNVILTGRKYYNLASLDPSFIRQHMLFALTFLSISGHVVALFFNGRLLTMRRESWFCLAHLLFVGLLNGYMPVMTQIPYETGDQILCFGQYFCRFLQNVRLYFLSLSNYLLVVLIINCYNIRIRPLAAMSASKINWCILLFYALGMLPMAAIKISRHYLEYFPQTQCIPYFFDAQYLSNRVYYCALFFLVYFVPFVLMGIFWFWFTMSLPLKNSSYLNRIPLARHDDCFIKMTCSMCISFVITNFPLMIQLLTIVGKGGDTNFDVDTAKYFEIAAAGNICLNPYIFLFWELGPTMRRRLTCSKSKGQRIDLNQNMCRCGYRDNNILNEKDVNIKFANDVLPTEKLKFLP